jgi:hypothetical protein
MGKPESGKEILVAQLGADLTQEDVHARLMASSHALMARSWLSIDSEGTVIIDQELLRAVRIITEPTFSLRYSYSTPEIDMLSTYHFHDGAIFEHFLEYGLVHNLVELSSPNDVIQKGIDFFQLSTLPTFHCSDAVVPNELMNSVKDEENRATVERKLEQAGVPDDTRPLLTEDIHASLYRGSILRIEYGADNTARADRGVLVLRGQQRLWLMFPLDQQDPPHVRIFPGTEAAFQEEVATLLE